jgi:uncharacterized membrane protein SirB2
MKYLIIILLFISTNLFSQNLYCKVKNAEQHILKYNKIVPFHKDNNLTEICYFVTTDNDTQEPTSLIYYWFKGNQTNNVLHITVQSFLFLDEYDKYFISQTIKQ